MYYKAELITSSKAELESLRDIIIALRKLLIIGIILILLVIDWFEFHDLFEPKTLPEFLTGLVSIPIIALFAMDLFGKKK